MPILRALCTDENLELQRIFPLGIIGTWQQQHGIFMSSEMGCMATKTITLFSSNVNGPLEIYSMSL